MVRRFLVRLLGKLGLFRPATVRTGLTPEEYQMLRELVAGKKV